MTSKKVRDQIEERAREWRLVLEHTFETETSFIVFGSRDTQPVVLKVLKQSGDEWRAGEIVEAFEGNGVVRIYEYTDGAMLLERLSPGNSLVSMVLNNRDEEATDIVADVIERACPRQAPKTCATVQDWAKGFERYSAAARDEIPKHLVEEGHLLYSGLCASQGRTRLLHGDLHHYNVLFDSERGWLAIDPKGVLGEIEFEIGAILRNPIERPDLFASSSAVERRLRQFAGRLNLDFERALAWGFAQAVLSAIWSLEDGFPVEATSPFLQLANAIRPMLGREAEV